MSNVLLVEDLQECQLVVRRALASSDIQLSVTGSVQEALKFLASEQRTTPDLVILDLSLPDGEGFTILEELRSKIGSDVPVFLLTSDAELDSKITAFNLGADDYLIKPISGIELRARVEMRLKKTSKDRKLGSTINRGRLTLDLSLMRTSIVESGRARTVSLTAKEFKILALLAQKPNLVYTRQELISNVWGPAVHVIDRTVDSHIFGLRKKLGALSGLIECIPHVGYRFKDDASENATPSEAI